MSRAKPLPPSGDCSKAVIVAVIAVLHSPSVLKTIGWTRVRQPWSTSISRSGRTSKLHAIADAQDRPPGFDGPLYFVRAFQTLSVRSSSGSLWSGSRVTCATVFPGSVVTVVAAWRMKLSAGRR